MTGTGPTGSAGPLGAVVDVLRGGQAIGFIGPGALEPHLHQAEAFAAAVDDPPARALDLGSGGGLPGLVLAVTAWTETSLTLMDASEQRTAYLQRAVDVLALAPRVSVERGRAEVLARDDRLRGHFDVVVARAFGAPAVVAECATGFLRPDGLLVVSEPPDGSTTGRWAHDNALAELGLGRDGVVELGDARFQRLRAIGQRPERYPRRDGVPAKHPLFR